MLSREKTWSRKVTADQAKYDQRKTWGFGNYCCIPGCKSAFYDSARQKTGISFFKIPSSSNDRKKRKKWVNILSNFRRSGSGDNFNLTDCSKRSYVCEFHFNFVICAREAKADIGLPVADDDDVDDVKIKPGECE